MEFVHVYMKQVPYEETSGVEASLDGEVLRTVLDPNELREVKDWILAEKKRLQTRRPYMLCGVPRECCPQEIPKRKPLPVYEHAGLHKVLADPASAKAVRRHGPDPVDADGDDRHNLARAWWPNAKPGASWPPPKRRQPGKKTVVRQRMFGSADRLCCCGLTSFREVLATRRPSLARAVRDISLTARAPFRALVAPTLNTTNRRITMSPPLMARVKRWLAHPALRRLAPVGRDAFAVFMYYYVGIGVLEKLEEWHTGTTIYFLSMTLTTVGFGDVAPTTVEGKWFVTAYAPAGIVLVFSIIARYMSAVQGWLRRGTEARPRRPRPVVDVRNPSRA